MPSLGSRALVDVSEGTPKMCGCRSGCSPSIPPTVTPGARRRPPPSIATSPIRGRSIGAVITTVAWLIQLFGGQPLGGGDEPAWFTFTVAIWLWLTVMFANLAGAQEALDLAAAYDVPQDVVLDAVSSSTGESWITRNWGFFDDVAAAYDGSGTPVRDRPWSKDLWDVVAAARERDVRVPVAGLLAQYLADRVELRDREGAGL